MSKLKSKKLLNIDSEDENVMIVSCAGGMAFENRIKFERVNSKLENPSACRIKISGLKGGHSGSDIHLGRANAIKLAAKVLEYLEGDKIEFELVSIKSGEAPNVIPSKSETIVLVEEQDVKKAMSTVEKAQENITKEYKHSEFKIKIELEKIDNKELKAIEKTAKERIISWIENFKNGVLTMSEDVEGLVESSDNVGTISTLEDKIIIVNECRSCADVRISEIKADMEELSNSTNTELEIKYSYPGWAFKNKSNLRKSFNESIEKIYGRKSQELAVHSGLEVGFFVDGVEGVDAISIGPNMLDIHTPEEKLDIISALKIWYALVDFLEK